MSGRLVLAVGAALGAAGCGLFTAPCDDVEMRWVASYQSWRVVCFDPQADGVQLCVAWPAPPMPPDWVGDPTAMAAQGVFLQARAVCHDLPLTETPR